MKRYQISLSELKMFVPKFAKTLSGGEIIALIGELGTGKTAFVKLLGQSLKIRRKITSPTFALLNLYKGKLPKNRKLVTLYHLDLYRLKGFREVRGVGLEEFWGKPGTITAIEWADRITRYLPRKTTVITFDRKAKQHPMSFPFSRKSRK